MSDSLPERPDDLDYELPTDAIAQTPLANRDQARLLVDIENTIKHHQVCDLPQLLREGDLLVINDTRVLPARLPLVRATGGKAEVLLLNEHDDDGFDGTTAEADDNSWEALVKPSARLKIGEILTPANQSTVLQAEIGDDLGEGRRIVRLHTDKPLHDALATVGIMPLPPYITTNLDDPDRYQTIYARRALSAAAPTAGLHFTSELFDNLAQAGIATASVELVVGLDTFRPITAERLDDHQIHTERYQIPPKTQQAITETKANNNRIVAVGTTVTRCLETWALTGQAEGSSSLFIRRRFDWQIVDILMTNFHLPKSSLLCLLDAFIGPRWRTLYETALANNYRFLSFGDGMLIKRAR